ncbi:hypothetical protein CPB84DRAFT_1800782 [Gymnopilus junonius]|uniref:Uncharacterized protein n=1 Tax=Gymnopilus junonius TaxID=109634 RepID=A0A9P5TFZ2_GYMJU|nr:hypothetical protein CPB84DRAFT_1800782 [Gymnopilus junonius]
MLTQPNKSDEELKATYNFIGVRDVSKAHVEVLKNEKAAGERIILANGASTWQDTRNYVHSLRPDLYASGVLPRGNPDLDNTVLYIYIYQQNEMIGDLLADFEARGWLKKPVDT